MGIFDEISVMNNAPRYDKVSQPWPNAANKIAAHLRAKWPELVNIPGLWFSGSQVWSWLYDKEPLATSDTDVFSLGDAPRISTVAEGDLFETVSRTPVGELLHKLGLKPEQGTLRLPRTGKDGTAYGKGACFTHERGSIDVWTSPYDVQGALRNYPGASHAHCRAAFSFTEGLVVLPNEVAP